MFRKTKKFAVFDISPRNDNDVIIVPDIDIKQSNNEVESIFNQLKCAIPIEVLCRKAHDDRLLFGDLCDTQSLIYGEIDFLSIESIVEQLRKLRIDLRGIFIDLGSGNGNSTLAFYLLGNFEVCVGIEMLPQLAVEANDIRNRLNNYLGLPSKLQFFEGSFFDANVFDWSHGDVIFINSTCFGPQMMSEISQWKKLKEGATIITLTYPLSCCAQGVNGNHFKLLLETRLSMNWGAADVYIFQVVSNQGSCDCMNHE